MKFKNSVAIVRTRKDNVVGCHMISTYGYEKENPNQFVYDEYRCKRFELVETVCGSVIIRTEDALEHSKAKITNEIIFENVTEIEILTAHKL